MNRFFKYADSTTESLLRGNRSHRFAMNHALQIYIPQAIYTFIPKNACSTMRLTLAMANGCVRNPKDFSWIHANNDTFRTDLVGALTAKYTFVVLRCPFARLASAYLDRFVDQAPFINQFYELTKKQVEIKDMSFEFFIRQLRHKPIRDANSHWLPQVSFLLYDEYDDYFCLEEFSKVPDILQKKIQLSVVDARPYTKHGLDELTLLGKQGEYAQHSIAQIVELKQSGQCPSPLSLYTDELINIVRTHYSDDVALYQSLFGTNKMMFS